MSYNLDKIEKVKEFNNPSFDYVKNYFETKDFNLSSAFARAIVAFDTSL